MPAASVFNSESAALSAKQKELIQLVKAQPQCGLFWFNLGGVFYLKQEFGKATTAYGKVLSLKSPLSPLAKFYLAKSQRRAGNLTDAILTLSEVQEKKLPKNMRAEIKKEKRETYSLGIDLATQQFQAGQNEEAEKTLIAILNLKQSASAYAALSVVLHRQAKWDREQTTLDYSRELVLSEEDSRVLKLLQSRLNRTDLLKDQPSWHLLLDAAVGYDTNVTRVSNSTGEHGSPAYRVITSAEKTLKMTRAYTSALNFGFTLDDYLELPRERYATAFLSNSNKFVSGKFVFGASPQMSYEMYGDRPYWFRAGVYAEAFYLGDRSSVGISYDGWANQTLDRDRYPDIGGSRQTLTSQWSFRKPETLSTSFGFAYTDFEMGEDVSTPGTRLPLAFRGLGPSVKFNWFFKDDWTATVFAGYQQRQFKEVTLPELKSRRDKLTTLAMTLRYDVRSDLSVYFDTTAMSRESSLTEDGLDYDSLTALVGFTWKPF